MLLNDVEREITKNVVQRFLYENKPSPRKLLVRRFRSSQAFYRLRDSGILANTAASAVTGEEVYLPRALAFYYCGDPDALRLARESVTIVIHALQNLFDDEPEKTRFTPEDLSLQAKKIIEPQPEPETLKLGLYLAHDIGVLTTWSPGDATTEPEFFQIAESIVEIHNFNKAWDDFIARSTAYDDTRQHEVAENGHPLMHLGNQGTAFLPDGGILPAGAYPVYASLEVDDEGAALGELHFACEPKHPPPISAGLEFDLHVPHPGSILDDTVNLRVRLVDDSGSIAGYVLGSIAQFRPTGTVKGSSGENAENDDLLPVLRRKVFDQQLEALGSTGSEGEPVSLLMLDLDHFKAVNDTHGHLVGDEVLIECADTIARRCRHKGKVYRFGEEEIAVLLPNFTVSEAVALAESIRSEIEAGTMSSKKLSITASIGVATAPIHATEGKQLLEAADEALYAAKHLGRNLVRIAGEDPETPTGDAQRRVEPMGAGQPVEMTLAHERLVCTAEHHNYRLTVTLKNISATLIDSYHVDVLFPAGFLRKDIVYALETPSRRTSTHSLLRVSTETGQLNTLYPGDSTMTMTIDYYVDRDIFTYHHEWLQQNVIATLYIKGSPPMRVQKPISELQEF